MASLPSRLIVVLVLVGRIMVLVTVVVVDFVAGCKGWRSPVWRGVHVQNGQRKLGTFFLAMCIALTIFVHVHLPLFVMNP